MEWQQIDIAGFYNAVDHGSPSMCELLVELSDLPFVHIFTIPLTTLPISFVRVCRDPLLISLVTTPSQLVLLA